MADCSLSYETAVCSALTTALPTDGAAPEWVQLLPVGRFQPNDGRAGWVLRDVSKVVAASLAAAPKGILAIDYDHAADLAAPKGGMAPAAGWIKELSARADGIWGRVEWTKAGASAIADKEYRFISPSFLHTKDGIVTRIVGAGLTNRPALPGLPALASFQGSTMDPILVAVLEALGLPKTADQAAVIDAITKLKDGSVTATAAAVPDPARYVPRAMYDEATMALASVRSNLTDEQTVAKVEAAIRDGKLTPAQRDWGLAICRQNPASFDEFSRTAPAVFANLSRELLPGARWGGGSSNKLTENQLALCASMNLDPSDYAKNLEA
ncbi:phage protease [Roseomonas genomospecies 6]|uniref:Mu-like prophage I protein n=1 Tax=Roseomonas genomospecies 6 TaxID=214106 RepID=A0A9W7U0L0_9PROT|nr:phage protease [Roseomonas genomospecies 6]KAA0683348.1 hypothetical protein DS843_02840 [Roseomonas genomospecies 6]